DPIDTSRSLFLHSAPLGIGKQSIIDSIHNISLTDMSSPSDVETACDFESKSDKNKLNGLLVVFDLSSIKDTRNANVLHEKCQILLKNTKALSNSFKRSSSSSTNETTLENNISYEDMEHLVIGFQKLVLMSDHSERIRLLTLCPPT
ncbi:unnamed protein product, partial [Rotaria socialis]